MYSKLERNYQRERDKRKAREGAERERKRRVWEWIKENDPALTKFLLDAPKGFIKNVRLYDPD